MVTFSRVEFSEWLKSGDDWFGPATGGVDEVDHELGGGPFGGRRVKDGRAIGVADVVALAIERGWIVNLEKEIEDSGMTGDVGVVSDLQCLGVTGVMLVSGVVITAAGVASFGVDNTWLRTKKFFEAPEAAASEDDNLFIHKT